MLELTEQSIATDPKRLVRRLTELRELGIQIALDDFGAGYSFLSFLEDYPLDALKIDRSLSRSIAEREDAALLLRGIVEVGAVNGMRVIVEGIETIAQRDRAEQLGIPLGQGYLFSRPMALPRLGAHRRLTAARAGASDAAALHRTVAPEAYVHRSDHARCA